MYVVITVDVIIGNNVIINRSCTLDHDDVIGDYVTAYPSVNISGNVTIEEKQNCEQCLKFKTKIIPELNFSFDISTRAFYGLITVELVEEYLRYLSNSLSVCYNQSSIECKEKSTHSS